MNNFYTKYEFVVDFLIGKNALQRNILRGKIHFATLSTTGKKYRSFSHLRKKFMYGPNLPPPPQESNDPPLISNSMNSCFDFLISCEFK